VLEHLLGRAPNGSEIGEVQFDAFCGAMGAGIDDRPASGFWIDPARVIAAVNGGPA
jgi:hypothetical protein